MQLLKKFLPILKIYILLQETNTLYLRFACKIVQVVQFQMYMFAEMINQKVRQNFHWKCEFFPNDKVPRVGNQSNCWKAKIVCFEVRILHCDKS